MTSLTLYGGVGEIGGNKILLEDRDTRLLLDFGLSFARLSEYFAEFILIPQGDLLQLGKELGPNTFGDLSPKPV